MDRGTASNFDSPIVFSGFIRGPDSPVVKGRGTSRPKSRRLLAGLVVFGSMVAFGPPRPAAANRPERVVGLSLPSHLAAIGSEQSGTIVEMPVRDGQRVRTKDVLFRLSSQLQELEVQRLEAQLASDLEQQEAAANLAHAETKANRVRKLSEKDISPEATALELELESELARISAGKVDFDRSQKQNELAQARERFAQRTLRSPLDGVVTRRFKQLGETADQLEPVIEVMSLDPLWIQFECPVRRETQYPIGSKILVRPASISAKPRVATIIHVSLQATVAGHTFLVRAALPNPDYSWRSGLKMLIEPNTSTHDPSTPLRGK